MEGNGEDRFPKITTTAAKYAAKSILLSSDDENLPWVMCDQCELWMQTGCIPVGVDQTPIDNEEQFFCHDCC